MRHDYDANHVNGAFAAVILTGFLVAVCGVLVVIAWIIS
jgi:hypothetical protein